MPGQRPISIFINYRRGDTRDQAREFKKALEEQLGQGVTVFLDERNIQLTEDWQPKVKEELRKAEVMLSLIGPDWEDQIRARARKADPEVDWVLFEIRQAMAEHIDIIPVFIDREQAGKVEQLLPEEFPEAARVFNGQGFVLKKNAHAEGLGQLIKSLKIFTGRDAQSHHKAPELDYLAALPLDQDAYLGKLWEKDDKGEFKVPAPFPGPIFFSEQEALLYAGRKKEIRTLHHLIRQHRLVLLHGYSGSGKSSLLHAGLFPRMKDIGLWQVLPPIRRSKAKGGLAEQLKTLLDPEMDSEKRVLIVLDQVEEMYNDPLHAPDGYSEIRELGKLLKKIWDEKTNYHLLLSFRSEFLSKVTKEFLPGHRLWNFEEFYLNPLGKENIVDAIREPVTHPGLKNRFRLSLPEKEEGLPARIAKDFTGDQFKPYGVLLQIQLKALWDAAEAEADARNNHDKELTESLYEQNRKTDLSAFIDDQLEAIQWVEDKKGRRKDEKWEKAVESGLILDILYQFISIEETAGSIGNEKFAEDYRHLDDPGPEAILKKLKSVYLLSAADKDGWSTRLAHDTLAPDIRRKYQLSEQPGQKARRLYESKKGAIQEQAEVLFSEQDARTILEGLYAMAAIPAGHEQKIRDDLKSYEAQHEKNFKLAFKTAEGNIENLEFEAAVDNLKIANQRDLHPGQVLEKAVELPYPLAFLKARDKLKEAVLLILNIPQPTQGHWLELKQRISPTDFPAENLFEEVKELLRQDEKLYRRMQERFFPNVKPIPGGTFEMGAEGNERIFKNEGPAHRVTVDPFQLGETPVTFWQYGLYCLAGGPGQIPGDSGFGRGNKPVINVSWYEAVAYCNWLSRQEGLRPVYALEAFPGAPNSWHNKMNWNAITDWDADGYRLPTEAEWEFAAGARIEKALLGKTEIRKWRFGNGKDRASVDEMNFDARPGGNNDWVKENREGWLSETREGEEGFRGKTSPVKFYKGKDEKPGNPFGLFDMSGNVYEWCWDWFAGNFNDQTDSYFQRCKENGVEINPRGAERSEGGLRVVRGGSWNGVALECRSVCRFRSNPFLQLLNLGFRVARRP
ncbi:MAG: SUMF1/EgtB/PvdO family nonheme iron enzyme [Lewinellaceae bacterium]|nr:SUMF1/EgtB/PvdO family nonheme iron enzyme [Phaeodactylibacter sp.]MCB9037756.1 SUMF1/EgtB/PvdO family nonheme iron enzyme [Lewinellaceae bacterium]